MSKKINDTNLHPAPSTLYPSKSLTSPTPSPLSPEKPRLLVVEDDPDLRTQMKWALGQDYEVLMAEDRPSALNILKNEHPPVVTLDLGLPPHPGETEEGFLALAEMLEVNPLVKVIIVTGQGEKENALEAVGQGAYDFFCKPIQTEDLKVILNRAFYLSQLEHERRDLQQRFREETFEGMLGTSSQMHEVFSSIRKVATTDVSVLIVGESGTGKELVAKAIHRQSLRKESPFITINCGAIPENLLESELFGHEKGAFTGAHIQRKGRFETAHGGTLFLDEIAELSLALQVKLLRFLQENRIERIGGREEIFVDARVLAATNKDLKQEIVDGKFREDLYYRLGVVTIALPPLRDREEDILVLATALLQRYSDENRKKITGFTKQAIRAIETHTWPGNIRELENRIKRAVIMAEGSKISPEDLEFGSTFKKYAEQGLREARDALERDFIQRAISRNKGNITQAATELGISRPTLYELMEKLGIGKEK